MADEISPARESGMRRPPAGKALCGHCWAGHLGGQDSQAGIVVVVVMAVVSAAGTNQFEILAREKEKKGGPA